MLVMMIVVSLHVLPQISHLPLPDFPGFIRLHGPENAFEDDGTDHGAKDADPRYHEQGSEDGAEDAEGLGLKGVGEGERCRDESSVGKDEGEPELVKFKLVVIDGGEEEVPTHVELNVMIGINRPDQLPMSSDADKEEPQTEAVKP